MATIATYFVVLYENSIIYGYVVKVPVETIVFLIKFPLTVVPTIEYRLEPSIFFK